MKTQYYYILLLSLALSGCAGPRPTAAVDVAQLVTDEDGCGRLQAVVRLPEGYVPRRTRAVFQPALATQAGTETRITPLEAAPAVVDGKIYRQKTRRAKELRSWQDPLADTPHRDARQSLRLPLEADVKLPAGVDSARLVALVSTDGCGECTGRDTLLLAHVSRPGEPLPQVEWMEPRIVVDSTLAHGRGVAHLQFLIDRHDIRPELGNNRAELEQMASKLAPVLSDTLSTLHELNIYGMASADGSIKWNTGLAERRAGMAKQWLVERLGMTEAVQRVITTGSRPEGWGPVLEAMEQAGDAGAAQVRAILEKYAQENDDVQERYIRRLPCWKRIASRYLQKDRKVEYAYTYSTKRYVTNAQLLAAYRQAPSELTELELLRVSTLQSSRQEKITVYRELLAKYPDSQIGRNNLAFLLLQDGQVKEARRVLAFMADKAQQ